MAQQLWSKIYWARRIGVGGGPEREKKKRKRERERERWRNAHKNYLPVKSTKVEKYKVVLLALGEVQ